MRLVVAVTGASGALIAERLMAALHQKGSRLDLVMTKQGKKVVEQESNVERIRGFAERVYEEDDFDAPIASGASKFDGMIVVPCSMKTLSAIANGYEANLVARAAGVCLKQGRKLILVPRETPLSALHLLNMVRASRAGATILPPVLTFYTKPKSVEDLVAFVVGRIMELLGLEHDLYRRWPG